MRRLIPGSQVLIHAGLPEPELGLCLQLDSGLLEGVWPSLHKASPELAGPGLEIRTSFSYFQKYPIIRNFVSQKCDNSRLCSVVLGGDESFHYLNLSIQQPSPHQPGVDSKSSFFRFSRRSLRWGFGTQHVPEPPQAGGFPRGLPGLLGLGGPERAPARPHQRCPFSQRADRAWL